jgi:hypothetical protein
MRRHAQSANSFRLRPFARHAAITFRNARISSRGIKRMRIGPRVFLMARAMTKITTTSGNAAGC